MSKAQVVATTAVAAPGRVQEGHVPAEQAAHGHGHEHGHGLLHHHFDDIEQQRESTSLGMWSFLSTEVMMFGGLFFCYTLYRHLTANAAHMNGEHDPFSAGGHLLNVTLGTANTFVLLFSSLTMAMAVHSAQERNKKMLLIFLALTFILGSIFIGIKAVEWTADYNEGLVPALNWNPSAEAFHAKGINPSSVNFDHLQMYFVIYFCMTGLHAIHMIIGLGIIIALAMMGRKDKFTNGNDQPVELFGLYWHFVDIVWVFLFPLLYLIGGFHIGGFGVH